MVKGLERLEQVVKVSDGCQSGEPRYISLSEQEVAFVTR